MMQKCDPRQLHDAHSAGCVATMFLQMEATATSLIKKSIKRSTESWIEAPRRKSILRCAQKTRILSRQSMVIASIPWVRAQLSTIFMCTHNTGDMDIRKPCWDS